MRLPVFTSTSTLGEACARLSRGRVSSASLPGSSERGSSTTIGITGDQPSRSFHGSGCSATPALVRGSHCAGRSRRTLPSGCSVSKNALGTPDRQWPPTSGLQSACVWPAGNATPSGATAPASARAASLPSPGESVAPPHPYRLQAATAHAPFLRHAPTIWLPCIIVSPPAPPPVRAGFPGYHPTMTDLDLTSLATRHGLTLRALELLRAHPVIDLHVDTYIPARLWGRDVRDRHGPGLLRGHFFGHLDLPRLRDQAIDAAMWSITTNVLRDPQSRWDTLVTNLGRLRALAATREAHASCVRLPAAAAAARAAGLHTLLVSIQGGNALEACPDLDAFLGTGDVWRVTPVHLTDSVYGPTSAPLSADRSARLPCAGRALIRALDRHRVAVDLAHIARAAFWDAVAAHDPALPIFCTHTGVCGVRPHWRNLDDAQVRAIAATGGVIGIIFANAFLARPGGPTDAARVAEHLEHLIDVGGEDCAAVGSDYDGAIVPPDGMRDGYGYARLVEVLLARGWPEARIARVLGGNAWQALSRLRPPEWQPAQAPEDPEPTSSGS
ncbi:MAG: hypothetical protein EXR79_16550 [Myxococcales bacterium]|nr:hypothetical protein [Myxococcales bacterium]